MRLSDFGNIFLSIFKHIEDNLTADGYIISGVNTGITLIDAYPDSYTIKNIKYRNDSTGATDEIVLPIISVEQGTPINIEPFELGESNNKLNYPIFVTLFSENKIQNLQLMGILKTLLLNKEINYYDYDQSFENPPTSGTLILEDFRMLPIQFTQEENPVLRWGVDIEFKLNRII